MSKKKEVNVEVEEVLSELYSFVFFVDGSSQPNPGYGGYGYFGYSLKEAKRPRSVNYPVKPGYQFSRSGIVPRGENEDRPYEVVDILEKVYSFNSDYVTNNIAELEGVLAVMNEIISNYPTETKELIIYTDSSYVVRGCNEFLKGWIKRNWKNVKGEDIANMSSWKNLLVAKETLESLNITLDLKWVKGHDSSVGNNIVDMYAVIGTNAAREQYLDGYHHDTDELFDHVPFKKTTPVSDFRKEVDYRPFIYNYKAMLFSANYEDDNDIAMVVSPEDEVTLGTRSYKEAYALLKGSVPKEINHIKATYRGEKHSYNSMVILHLNRIRQDKILMRIIDTVGFKPLLSKRSLNGEKTYLLEGQPFVEYLNHRFPFKLELNETFQVVHDVIGETDKLIEEKHMVDITNHFMEDGKLSLKFQDKVIDLENTFTLEDHEFITKPLLTIGSDTPPYAVFKEIGDDIEKVYAYPELQACGNLATMVLVIHYKTPDGTSSLSQTNFLGKYLIRRTTPLVA